MKEFLITGVIHYTDEHYFFIQTKEYLSPNTFASILPFVVRTAFVVLFVYSALLRNTWEQTLLKVPGIPKKISTYLKYIYIYIDYIQRFLTLVITRELALSVWLRPQGRAWYIFRIFAQSVKKLIYLALGNSNLGVTSLPCTEMCRIKLYRDK